MAMNHELWYFLIMPEPKCGWAKRLGYKDEFVELFRLLGDPEVLRVICHPNERDNKPFTPRLIEKAIGVDSARAEEILQRLLAAKLVRSSTIELDDGLLTVYSLVPNPAIVAVLALCGELIRKPNCFYCNSVSRDKPYLQSR